MALDGRLTPLDVIIAKIPTWLPEKPETRPTVLLAPEQVKYVVSEAVVSVETFHKQKSEGYCTLPELWEPIKCESGLGECTHKKSEG